MKYKENSRIKELRTLLNVTQKDFAKQLDVTQGYVSDLEVGRSSISFNVLKKLYELYSYNPLYHISGYGNVIVQGIMNENPDVSPKDVLAVRKSTGLTKIGDHVERIKELERALLEKEKEIRVLDKELSGSKDKIIALLEKISGL